MRLKALCLALMTALAASPARSAEGGFYSGPIGGSDIRSAILSTPGSLAFSLSFAPQFSNLSAGPDGKPSPAARSVAFFAQSIPAGLSYVYPFTLDGGKFGSKIQDQYSFACYRKNSKSQCDSGFADPYTDLLIYSKYIGLFGVRPPSEGSGHLKLPYGLTIAPAFSMSVPLGRYNSTQLLNQGHNSWIFIPNIAATYITGPNLSLGDATEIDTRLYYQTSSDNPRSGYRNGDTFVDDFAITERLHYWQVGVAGTVATATTDDTRHRVPVAPYGNRLYDLLVGPVIQVDVPQWHASFGLKSLLEADSHNRLGHNLILLRSTFTLF